jgi:thymidylate synthase
MNELDKQYQSLLSDILKNGWEKGDRTGTGTLSVFGRSIRHNMRDGFPILTTKKMYMRGIIGELIWFLKGETNIRPLLEDRIGIWTGDAYKRYLGYRNSILGLKAPASEEALSKYIRWYESVENKSDFENLILNDDEFCQKFGELGPIYGSQWRKWRRGDGYIDQIKNLIEDLKNNPDSRRMMVTAWQPSQMEEMVLPPCHYGFQVWTRELTFKERRDLAYEYAIKMGKIPLLIDAHGSDGIPEYEEVIDRTGWNIPKREISLLWNQRSVDVPLGLPFNISSYGALLILLSEILNMVPGELIGNLGDVHIYKNQIGGVMEQLQRDSYKLPKMILNTEFWPTKSGECGEGDLVDDIDVILKNINISDFQLLGYESHPKIEFPLSN